MSDHVAVARVLGNFGFKTGTTVRGISSDSEVFYRECMRIHLDFLRLASGGMCWPQRQRGEYCPARFAQQIT